MRDGHQRRVIMLVDDQAGNRDVLGTFLNWSGYKVIEATNGQEAVQIASADCPDLIFMDLAMPVMDGFHAVRLLREITKTCNVPIIAYTAYDTRLFRERALNAGFNDYLTKPIDFKVVESILDRFLART